MTSTDTAPSPVAIDHITTLEQYILAEETQHPGATGQFSWILSALSFSAKFIASKIRLARIQDVLGELHSSNIQGETQQKLDVVANATLIRALGSRGAVAVLASEEDETPTILDCNADRAYCVLFDPLDGSSNLDACVSVGTIFSILRHDPTAPTAEASLLQTGVQQVAAGYILYGSSTVFVLTHGNGVMIFVLEPSIGSFVLAERDVRIPTGKRSYSVNEAYRATFPEGYQAYLDWAHDNGYSSRYVGTMVADVHRVLVQGGVFLYPPTQKNPEGKLRLMYEANPMAMIIEQAGGKAYAGTQRIMEIEPREIHQRTSVILGGSGEVDNVLRHLD
jgi:fructose-1,6-bisphosphatase I